MFFALIRVEPQNALESKPFRCYTEIGEPVQRKKYAGRGLTSTNGKGEGEMDQTENNNENRIAQEGKRDNANETGRILKDNELNAVTGGNNSENLMKEFLRRFECTCETPVPSNNGICLFCGNVIIGPGDAGKNDSGGGIAPAPK